MRNSLNTDPVLLQFRVQFPESAEREKDDVVIRIFSSSENALTPLGYADDGKHLAFNVDLFTFRLLVVEQFIRGVSAKNNHIGAALVVNVAEPAA